MRIDSLPSTSLVTCLACLGLLWGTGCESSRFEDAPTARASSISPTSGRSAQQGSSEKNGDQLPQGHPPVGSIQEGGGNNSGGNTRNAPAPSAGSNAPKRGGGTGGGASLPVDWTVPDAWKQVDPASRMREAQYRLPGADGANPATMAVYHFGKRGGGSVKANIDRWIGQFEPSGGRSPREAADTEERTIDGMTVHVVDIQGRFNPGRGMGAGKAKDDQRLLGMIAETPGGMVFFKLVGPAKTVGAHESAFDTFVSSLSPSG